MYSDQMNHLTEIYYASLREVQSSTTVPEGYQSSITECDECLIGATIELLADLLEGIAHPHLPLTADEHAEDRTITLRSLRALADSSVAALRTKRAT